MSTMPLTQQNSSSFSLTSVARHFIPTLIENSIPFGIYFLLKDLTGASDVVALSVGALVPAGLAIWQIVRTRRVNVVTLLILLGLVGSIIAALLGGDARLLLIRESAIGVVMGLSFLVSLLFARPLFFTLVCQMRAGKDAQKLAAFEERWQQPAQRRAFRLVTAVLGLVLVGEFILRVAIVLSTPIALAVMLTNIIPFMIYIATLVWIVWYMRLVTKASV